MDKATSLHYDETESDQEVVPGFVSFLPKLPDLDKLGATVDKQLQRLQNAFQSSQPIGDPNRTRNATSLDWHEDFNRQLQQLEQVDLDLNGDGEESNAPVEVEGFLRHQNAYNQNVVFKKLKLYEKQLQMRQSQVESLVKAMDQAQQQIAKLKKTIADQKQEFAKAEEVWEEEKNELLRYRNNGGGVGGGGTSAMALAGLTGMMGGAANAKMRAAELENQKQKEHRLQMLKGAVDAQDQIDGDAGVAIGNTVNVTWQKIKRFLAKFYLFSSDVRQIEARFGNSVASYFKFFRWIILSFMICSLPCTYLLVAHIRFLHTSSTSTSWFAFTGVAPTILLASSHHPTEALRYTGALVVVQLILFLFTIRKWVLEDRLSKTFEAVEGDKQPKYSKAILNAWDFGLTTAEQASDLKKSISEQILVVMGEEKMLETIKKRTNKEKYILYARRFVASVLYIVLQASSWYVIIWITTKSSELQRAIATKYPPLTSYVSIIVPSTVTVINAALPSIISFLTKLERWDDVGFGIKAMVARLFLAKILNILIQVFSFLLLLDPFLLTATISIISKTWTFQGSSIRKNVMQVFKEDAYECRAQQVGSGLITLVVTDFAFGKVFPLLVPFITWVLGLLLLMVQKAMVLLKKTKPIQTNSSPSTTIDTIRRSSKVLPATDSILPTTDSSLQAKPNDKASSSSPSPSSSLPTNPPVPSTSSSRRRQKSEFQVPQKMVALFYSTTIALVSIPLAPSMALLSLFLLVINFKFDKFFLLHFQKKPMNPWSAKDAGNFFIKFYFTTIVIFLAFTHFFLWNPLLPKDCTIQDLTLELTDQLCRSNTYNPATELCAIDSSHESSAYFTGNECPQGYPKCVCSGGLACGPFRSAANGYAPLVAYMKTINVVSGLFQWMTSSVLLIWLLLLAALLVLLFLHNTLKVFMLVTAAREQEMALTLASFRKKIKQLENRLRLQKLANDPASSSTLPAS